MRAVVETGEAPEKLWGSMIALDWPALAIPEEYGGIGLTFLETAVVVEELGRAIAPGPLLPTVTQFAPMIREVGAPEQRQRFLSQVATGTSRGPWRWPTIRGAGPLPTSPCPPNVARAAGPRRAKFGVLAGEGTTDVSSWPA